MQTHTTNYLSDVFNFIAAKEGKELFPYFDTATPAKASIGYGVNLEVSDYLRIVLQTMGLFDGKTDAQIAAIQQTFTNAINTTAHGQGSTYKNALQTSLDKAAQLCGLTSFAVTDAQATAAFYVILSGATIGGKVIAGKEAKLDAILNYSLSHDSKEYVAVMSLYYNVESLVPAGGGLATAIINGNRAEAWYEIRYRSNANHGHANRRYQESDLFGLYDNAAAPTIDDAKQAYRTFTLHRDDILSYEGNYSPTNVNAGSTAISNKLGLACVTILGDLAGNANPDIANAYAAWVAAGNDPLNFDTTKLFLDPGRGNAVDARQYSVPGVMGVEVASNDIVIGEAPLMERAATCSSAAWEMTCS